MGTISLVFNRPAISAKGSRIWFGNSSGVALGFDWSDSASLSPAFNPAKSTLSYSVGPTFAIDPVTVGTGNTAGINDYQRQTFYANGLFWAFYSDGTNYVYRTSSNGTTWSSSTVVRSWYSGGGISFWVNPSTNTVYYAVGLGTQAFAYRYGTLSSSGSISWSISETQVTTYCGSTAYPSIVLDSNNNVWVSEGDQCSGGFYVEVDEYTSSWSRQLLVSQTTLATDLVPLTSGKIALIYKTSSCNCFQIYEWSGSSWSNSIGPTGTGTLELGSATAIGDTVYMAVSNYNQGIWFLTYSYGGSWSHSVLDTRGYTSTISTDNAGNLIVFTWEASTGTMGGLGGRVVYNITSSGGSTWPSNGVISYNEPTNGYINHISSPFLVPNNLAPAIWISGTSSPYNIRFAAIPIVVPDASISAKSWNKPGLAPYASYFQNLGDYVSPGNGLLSVEQTDLQLSGRGLDLSLTRVFSTPYAFQASTPTLSGYATGSCSSATSCTTSTLTTGGSPILLYVTALVDGGHTVSGLSSSSALTWQKRSSVTLPASSFTSCTSSSKCDEETWYAVDPFQFSGTVTVSTTGSSHIEIIALGIAGANTAPGLIFDSNSAVPCIGTATSGYATCTISTNNPDDFIIGAEADSSYSVCMAGSTFSKITGLVPSSGTDLCLEDYPTSSPQSNLAVTVSGPSCSSSFVCAMIGDAITGAQPYQYDSYTASNLGLGWALNFPWFGTNYFHYLNGEAFPYQWSGNTFTYHGAVDFQLVNNGGSYTLYDASGTTYQFNTNRQLTSVTDRTSNNTISFSYGSNGYISQITDTIGRTVTFSYNSNNQLSSISSGGRAWTYGYSGNNLVSMTDPLNRVTTYQYNTGLNNWLLGAIVYPTGGQTTYSYGSAPVGTEMLSYYVTSRNIYSSSTVISRSDSFSYNVANALVTWTHMKSADGHQNVQAYDNYNFLTTPKSLMRLYESNANNQTIREIEYDYDTSGRINETKQISPTNVLLAYSIQSYDNWGNVVYTEDNIGQQTWYSYANTNSANSFGTSGCTSSFYTQTISSNIYDALVGECDYQNGSSSPQQETFYEYSSAGNLLQQKVSHSSGWLYTTDTYDHYGNILSTTNANGYETFYRYSSTYSSAYLTKQSILVGTQNVTATYTYNLANGFMLSETDPNGQTTSYQYDNLGRVTLITYPAVGGTSATMQYTYDDKHDNVTITDSDGHVTNETFDGLGRNLAIVRFNGTIVYSRQAFTYNWLNLVATNTTAAG